MPGRRIDRTVWALALLTAGAASGLTVNPWPRDGWYLSQFLLLGRFPGHDDYTPIAAPALVYAATHQIAIHLGLGLAGELYLASLVQCGLVLLSAIFVYYALERLRLDRWAAPTAVGLLLFVLSTGMAQCFYSECITLFLMSAVILVLAPLVADGDAGGMRWSRAMLCGLLVGMLVLTRSTPIILIPAIALLLHGRTPTRQAIRFSGTVAAITLLMLTAQILGNHARFGRYELTNSAGRHLWQGVKDFSDRALAHSPEYQALRRRDPDVQGTSWWNVPPVTVEGYNEVDPRRRLPVDPREATLRMLSLEAIRNAPGLYLLRGARKFVATIGLGPARVGFSKPGPWNPLHTAERLPPPASILGAPATYGMAVDAATRYINLGFRWVYPVVIFAAALTCIARMIALIDRLIRRRSRLLDGPRPIALATAFHLLGIPLALMPVALFGATLPGIGGSAACACMLGLCAPSVERHLNSESGFPRPRGTLSFFSFCALLFFGSLWLCWQIEERVPRYAIPLLPFWSIMPAMAAEYWRSLRISALSPATAVRMTRPTPV